ncbi:MAG TPA: class I SAM-dependent methyltransferase [Arenicellales bacterium]|nr:class I SAM-dependent methyltransferase [Arenicellales bacterium]
MSDSLSEEQRLLLRLFDKSVLKKAKYAAISRYLPALEGLRCLDIGADNGVISYLLRQRGGQWTSADLDEDVVESIRGMVGERVCRLDGGPVPFADASFDLVVIIDALEHLHDDAGFVRELRRIMTDDAVLIANVPHDKPRSLIRKLRLALGLTDEKHGHVRPGYDAGSLRELLAPDFEIVDSHTYSRFFVELFDAAISFYFDRARNGHSSTKGNVITGDELRKRQRQFRLFSVIYPIVALLQILDRALFFTSGHSLIVRARVAS